MKRRSSESLPNPRNEAWEARLAEETERQIDKILAEHKATKSSVVLSREDVRDNAKIRAVQVLENMPTFEENDPFLR
jgi:hypothetical protein